jgi:hypothetical protein
MPALIIIVGVVTALVIGATLLMRWSRRQQADAAAARAQLAERLGLTASAEGRRLTGAYQGRDGSISEGRSIRSDGSSGFVRMSVALDTTLFVAVVALAQARMTCTRTALMVDGSVRRACVTWLAVGLMSAWWPAVASGQIDAGLLASARDREITTTYDTSTNRTSVTLAIVPPGTGGEPSGVVLMFVGEFAGRAPVAGSTTLTVRAHITPRSDPRDRDPRTGTEGRELVFRLDPHTNSGIALYLYARSWGYSGFVAPGDEIPVAFFTVTPAELKALRAARAITGRALGSEFLLAPDQLAAIAEFAGTLGL